MAEIWGAAIMVVGAVAQSQAEKKKAEQARKDQRVDNREQAKFTAMLSDFEGQQDRYYKQLEKQDKYRGLDQFKQFSGMQRIDPNYVEQNRGIVVPEKPDAEKFFAEPPKAKKVKKKKGGFRGFIDKYDPLGSKLIDIDPISSGVLGKSYEEVKVDPNAQRPVVPVTGGGT